MSLRKAFNKCVDGFVAVALAAGGGWAGPIAAAFYLQDKKRWKCPDCGKLVRTSANYCPGCGAADPALCQACGRKDEAGPRYCTHCGHDRDQDKAEPPLAAGPDVNRKTA